MRADFAKAGTAILGVSADPVTAQDKFKAKHRLSIALGSDETKEMLTAYGAWGEKSMYGRKFMGVLRKTFLMARTAASPRFGRKFACLAMPKTFCWLHAMRNPQQSLKNPSR